MPISKIKSSSITADAASTNLNIDANTLFLDATNNRIGVGNTAPDVKLQVTDTIDVGIAMSNSSSVTTGNRGSLAMFNSANSTVGLIRFGAVTDNVGTDIQFYSRPAAGALAQTMTLTSAGNLGIGTTNPQFKFHVRGADATSLFVVGNTTEDTRLEVSTYQDDRIVLRANDSSNIARSIAFETGLNERMRITSSGAVGIATSDPAATLDVATSSGSAGQINTHIMLSRGTSTGAFLQTERAAASNNVSALIFGVNSAERMRVTDVGYVGIGTNAPTQPLDVAGTANITTLLIRNAGVATVPGNTTPTFCSPVSGTLVLSNNGNESFRVTAANNLGVGTTAPLSRISTMGAGSTVGLASHAALRIQPSGTGSTDQIIFGYAESGSYANAAIGFTATDYNGYQKGHIFFANRNSTSNVTPTERVRITAPGEVLIGQTTTYNGAGISIQPNLATAAVGINGNFATVWNIPTGTCGLFTVHMGGNGQYGGAALFFVTWGSAAGINNASITQIVGPQGDQSGYSWSYNLASNGQFQMRNNTNSVNFTPVINLITLG